MMHKFFAENLEGMIHRSDWDKTPVESCLLSKNTSYANLGTWEARQGTNLLAATQAGSGVQNLTVFTTPTKQQVLKAVRSGDTDFYDKSTDTFVQQVTSNFLGSMVESAQFLGETYYISEDDNLQYSKAGVTTIVGAGGNEIKGETLSVAQGRMFVGKGEMIYYTDFLNSAEPTDKLWKDGESGLIASTNYIKLSKPHTAQFSFGITGLNYIFTDDACFVFDLERAETRAVAKVFDIGCASKRAIGVVKNAMVWMAPDGEIWAWGGSGQPINISLGVSTEGKEESLIKAIKVNDLSKVAFGSLNGEFWFSVGDITLFNRTIENACVYGFTSSNFKETMWGVHSFPVLPAIFTKAKINGDENLFFGTNGVDDVYQMNVGTSDNEVAIDSFVMTRFYQFGSVFETQEPKKMIVKYKPTSSDSYLDISFAKNVTNDYTEFSNFSSGEDDYGIINMQSDNPLEKSARKFIGLPSNTRGTSISFLLKNSTLDNAMSIQGFGLLVDISDLDQNIKHE